MRPYRLKRLYQGAGLGSLASDIGETSAYSSSLVGAQEAERRRGRLLAQAVVDDKLDVTKLSQADSALASQYMGSVKKPMVPRGISGGLSKIGGFFENLGSDIWNSAKGIPAGLAETTGAVLSDIGSAIVPSGGGPMGIRKSDFGEPGSDVKARVVDPTVEAYKYMYAGEGAEPGSSFWDRFYEHPLQPILDVATVASLGAGGAARAGVAPAVVRTTGRAPLRLGEGAEIPREYSARPLRNLGQRAVDPLERLVPKFGEFRTSRGVKRMQREESAREMAGEASAVRHAVTPLVRTTKDLPYDEGIALDYSLRGWNTPEKIQATREMFQDSLAGRLEPGNNIADFQGIFDSPEAARAYVSFKANLPASIEEKILNPTPGMIEAAKARRADIDAAFERAGLPPEEIVARHSRSQRILEDYLAKRGGGEEPGPEGGPPSPPPEGPPPEPVEPENPPLDDTPLEEVSRIDEPEWERQARGAPRVDYRSLDDGPKIGGFTWRELAENMEDQAEAAGMRDAGSWGSEGAVAYEDMAAGEILGGGEGNVNFVLWSDDFKEVRAYGNIQYFGGETQFFIAADDMASRTAMLQSMEDYHKFRQEEMKDTPGVSQSDIDRVQGILDEAYGLWDSYSDLQQNIIRAADGLHKSFGDYNQWVMGLQQKAEMGEADADASLDEFAAAVHKANRSTKGDPVDSELIYNSLVDHALGIEEWETFVEKVIMAQRKIKEDLSQYGERPTPQELSQYLADSWERDIVEEDNKFPEIPEGPASLFEQWGMPSEIEIPEFPDTPGAFFAQYGEPESADFPPIGEGERDMTGFDEFMARQPEIPEIPDTPESLFETWAGNRDEVTGDEGPPLEFQELRDQIDAFGEMLDKKGPEDFLRGQFGDNLENMTWGDDFGDAIYEMLKRRIGQDPEAAGWDQAAMDEFIQGAQDFFIQRGYNFPDEGGKWNLQADPDSPIGFAPGEEFRKENPYNHPTPEEFWQLFQEYSTEWGLDQSYPSGMPSGAGRGGMDLTGPDIPDFLEDVYGAEAKTPEEFDREYPAYYGEPTTPEQFYQQEGTGEINPPIPPTNGPPEVTGGFGTPEGYPIQPTWTPDQLARGFKEQRLGWLAKLTTGQPESQFVRGKRDRRITPGGVTSSNLFEASGDSALREPGPEALMSGAVRMDPKSFVEHVARRERDIVAQAFDQHILQQVAAKGENGEPVRFSTQRDVEKALGNNWVLVHDQFPIKWFVGETEFLRDTINKLQEMQEMGIGLSDENVLNELEKLADDHAQEFVRKSFGAKKIDGVAVPRNFFEYQKRIVQATDPFDHPAGRTLARYIHRWRTLTLAYMPRWAVNTAVGSFLLNMVKGVGWRGEYGTAKRMSREGRFAQPDLAGVELGNVIGLDYLEPGMHGVGGGIERQTGVKVTGFGERIVEKVQQIEDYFRRASFIHSLDRVAKQRMSEMGTVLSNLERRRGLRTDDEYIAELMQNPQLVKAAIDDLNKFSYNFAALGPYERRYVRLAIPFWGWYKFISKFAYRLPVEYPGRSNILANIGMLGNMSQEEAGMFPEWMRGFIPLKESDKGELTYLSTLGINPLGQFFNPFGKQGLVQGAVNVGQASPPIQAGLAALGVDTLRGGVVPISPQSGVAPDFFGSWIDTRKGTETSPLIEGALRRGVMGLIRAAPQVRMAEERLAGGRPVYPESIPFISERPMPIREGTRRDTSLLATMAQMTGVYPKHFDLRAYQRLLPERVKYARARNRTQMKRLRKSLRNP